MVTGDGWDKSKENSGNIKEDGEVKSKNLRASKNQCIFFGMEIK